MKGKHFAVACVLILTLVGIGLAQLQPAVHAAPELRGPQSQMDMSGMADEGIPAYHAYALKPPFPVTLDPKQFTDPLIRNVYALAGKIKPVLFQQPCFCYCDRHAGHKSLLDCYVDNHGTECEICQREAILSYQLTQKGKTPAQVREAIIRGDWKTLSLQPYMVDLKTR